MDEEVTALLNSKVGDMDDNELGTTENRGDAADVDECRSVSVVGKSDTSSSFSGSDDLTSSVVDDDSADEYSKTCIRVGDSYQVFISDKLPTTRVKDDPREGVLLWQSSDVVSNEQVAEYVQYACDTHRFSIEQALGLLLWHNHNIELAKADLPNFEPSAETWSADDISLFEEAYKIHNKRFHSYTELLPHKTMGSLVDYYYSRYKRRSSSFTPMNLRSSHVGAFSATVPTTTAPKVAAAPSPQSNSPPENVNIASSNNKSVNNLVGANSQSGILLDPRIKVLPSVINPTNPQPPVASANSANGKSKAPFARPPRGLYLRLEELAALASLAASSRSVSPPTDPLDGPRAELSASLNRLQQQRARCNDYKRQLAGGIQSFRQLTPAVVSGTAGQSTSPTTEPQWTKHETSLAVAAFRQYGANFTLIADFIGTKSEAHVRYFYQTYRNRYNLDTLLAEYEAERRNLNLFPSVEEDYLKRKNASIMSHRTIGNGVNNNTNKFGRRPDDSVDFSQPRQQQHSDMQRLMYGGKSSPAGVI